MKTIIALPLLVLGLAACEPYPQGQGYPGYPQPYPQEPQGYPQPYPPGPALSQAPAAVRRCRRERPIRDRASRPIRRRAIRTGLSSRPGDLSGDRHRAFLGSGDRPEPDLHRPRQQCQRGPADAAADRRHGGRNLPDAAARGEHRPHALQRRNERPQLSRHGQGLGRRPAVSRLRRADRLLQPGRRKRPAQLPRRRRACIPEDPCPI